MTRPYLLPCRCGKTIPIETRQAGETVRCACGAEQEAPTLLEIRKLPQVEPDPAAPGSVAAPGWGLPEQLTLVGAILLVIGLLLAGYFQATRPALPAPADIRRRVGHATPVELVHGFRALRQMGLPTEQSAEDARLEERIRYHRTGLAAALVVAAAGAGVLAAGRIVRRMGAQSRRC
jgi:hypothetical protein